MKAVRQVRSLTAVSLNVTVLNMVLSAPIQSDASKRSAGDSTARLTEFEMRQVSGGQGYSTIGNVLCRATNEVYDFIVDDPHLPIPCSASNLPPWTEALANEIEARFWEMLGGYQRVYDAEAGWTNVICNQDACWGGYTDFVEVWGTWPSEYCGYQDCVCDYDSDCYSAMCLGDGFGPGYCAGGGT